MIQPQTALRRILRHCTPLGSVRVPIGDALGRVLADDARSRIPLPPFDNSQMDGYAVRARDCRHATSARPARLRITGTLHAGARRSRAIRSGEAAAVATGAPVPRGADAVVPIEGVAVEGRWVSVPAPVARGRYVRRRGEEMRAGERVLVRGAVVHAGAVACLASAGLGTVRVVRAPRVAVITTGDEIVDPGTRLEPGQVYDSNVASLAALLRQAGIVAERLQRVRDDPRRVSRALSGALAHADVVVTVGGVSVGPRDFVRGALAGLGVREVFWGVRQQPGKPLYFGHRGRRLVFGLPGNPASAFVCFCVYVLPALRALGGHAGPYHVMEERVLASPVTADPSRWRLLRARASDDAPGRIDVSPRQGSHMATALGWASHLVLIPPGGTGIPAGRRVQCLRLPHAGDVR